MGYSIWLNSKLILKMNGRYSDLTNLNPWPQVIAMPEEISHPNIDKSKACLFLLLFFLKNSTQVKLFLFLGLVTSSRVVAGTLAGSIESPIVSGRMFQDGGAIDSSLWNNKLTIAGANGNVGIFNHKTPFIRTHQIKKKSIEGIVSRFPNK